MNEITDITGSTALAAIGVTESGQLLAVLRCGKKPMLYMFDAGDNANSLYRDWLAAESKGRFYNEIIRPLKMPFAKGPATENPSGGFGVS